jgi:hypothetical protein
MTTVMLFHRQTLSMPRLPRERRLNAGAAMVLFDAGFLVLRPVVVTVAVLIAAADWSAPAQSAVVGHSTPQVMSRDVVIDTSANVRTWPATRA